MTLVLSDVVTAARDRSPWFHPVRVTDAVIARFLSEAQNELIGAAVRRDPQYLAQTANIVVALSGSDAPGTVGAGTTGGTPGSSDSGGLFTPAQGTIGSLVEAKVTAAEGASLFVADRVVSSAATTSITSTGANRTTNQDAQRMVVITSGTGYGQRRLVLSNTADTWVISTGSDGQQWTTTPDSSSTFDVVSPVYGSDDAIGVVTGLPAVTTSVGYLVKVSAQGVPFIDFTQPLVATVDAGASLPAMQFPLDGTVWYVDGSCGPLRLVPVTQRFGAFPQHTAYAVDQQLYLVGESADWQDVASISLRYTPIAPAFTALTDTFLLPDHARPALIAMSAAFMAERVSAWPDVSITIAPLNQRAAESRVAYLANVSAAKRGRNLRVREVY